MHSTYFRLLDASRSRSALIVIAAGILFADAATVGTVRVPNLLPSHLRHGKQASRMTTRARASASRLRAPVLAAPVDVQDDLEQLSQERSEILEKLKIVEQRIIAATQAQKEEDERAAMGKHNDELLEQELPPSEEQSVDQAAAIETLIAAGVAVESAAASYCPSFGYLSKSGGNYVRTNASVPGGVPSGLLDLGFRNFKRELNELTTSIRRFVQGDSAEPLVVSQTNPMENAEVMALREALRNLTLSNEAVWDREKSRPSVEAPLVLTIPYYVLCYALDYCFDGRPLARFWFLETVARMPYFSYITMLHLYETLGWWRRSAETKRVHFAEEWNEFNHLMIMESLGGDQRWVDRFLAQHAAIVYFIVLTLLWLVSPTLSYNFSELIEAHAVDTYGEFVDANEALLKQIPPPTVAKAYYESDDLYFFDEFQTARPRGSRRPKISSLYDVFSCVRDDEVRSRGARLTNLEWQRASLAAFGSMFSLFLSPYPFSPLLSSTRFNRHPVLQLCCLLFLRWSASVHFSMPLKPLVAFSVDSKEQNPAGRSLSCVHRMERATSWKQTHW
uniref:Ubiquinol oxidase n=1 Tax=Chrysotila carterae TaxID=13221 RepID=A0A7S4BI63_CHRCT